MLPEDKNEVQEGNIFRLLLEEEDLKQQLKDSTQLLREKLNAVKTRIRRILSERGQQYLNFPKPATA